MNETKGHDPLCHAYPLTVNGGYHDPECCDCDLIRRVVKREQEKMQTLIDALAFYADPATYHALAIWADPPCGDFVNDYSEDHGDDFYDRPMPGKTAREALALFTTEEKSDDVMLDALDAEYKHGYLAGELAERERIEQAIEALLPSTHDLYNQGIRDAARVAREQKEVPDDQ